MSSLTGIEDPQAAKPYGVATQSRTWTHILLIVVLWAIIYLPALSAPALLDDADSVHAEAAREMVTRGDWVTLHANGVRYLEKAPLMYWTVAASYTLFGVSEWSTRLPLALATLALLLAIYSLGTRTLGRRAGLYAAIVTATAFGTYLFTRILIPEALVGLWLTLGFDFFWRGLREEKPSRTSCWGLAVTAALSVLTKGLIGLVFPAAVIFLHLLLTGNLRHLLRMRLVSSATIFFAIATPWHVFAGLSNPPQGEARGFFWFYFVNEHFLRYLGKRFPKDYDTVPFLVFWGLMLLWVLPWTPFLFQSLAKVPHRVREFVRLDDPARARLLFAIWATVILVFFSFSSRQEYYTIPALPALALLVGGWLAEEQESAKGSALRRSAIRSSLAFAILGALVFATAMWLLAESKSVPEGSDISELLTRNPDKYALSLGHIFDLTPEAMGAFRWPLALTGIAFLLGTGLNWWFRRLQRTTAANASLIGMMIVVLACVHQGFVTFEPILSSKTLAVAINQHLQPDDVIVINGEYEAGSTLNFYTGRNVHIINSREKGNMWFGSLFSDAPKIFENDQSFAELWTSPTRVWLWVEEDKVPKIVRATPNYALTSRGGKRILTNKPVE
jgi:4-amino-4-deoxy-L-arabinose transferase-like glycosyltransferase